jgi:hypothetical protein
MPLSSDTKVWVSGPNGASYGDDMPTLAELAAQLGVIASNPAAAWPVGSIFTSVVATNPATLLGFGTWAAFGAGRVLVGLDSGQTEFDAVKETGGSKTHTLITAEMPSHTHVQTQNSATTGGLAGYAARDTSTSTQVATGYTTEATGGGGAHNNLQPYIVVHFWERTA